VYLDDIIIFSKDRRDHLELLKEIFEKCRAFSISLNTKKYIFIVKEDKFLGHVVSKQGMSIKPEGVLAIRNIPLPSNKKAIQSFFDHIDFVRNFIYEFSQIIKCISYTLKKDMAFLWTMKARKSFNNIKEAIVIAPMLKNPDFTKNFILCIIGS